MSEGEEVWHVPVMTQEVLSHLLTESTRTIVDFTVGTGGHALEMLRASPRRTVLVGLDRDRDALEIARQRLAAFRDRVILMNVDFSDVLEAAPSDIVGNVDAALIDCGISRLEIVKPDRGFSFDREGPLDMRFDTFGQATAKSLLGRMTDRELTGLLTQFGERSRARRLSRAILKRRDEGRMNTTIDLAEAVKSVVPTRAAKSLARVFLALRVAVNRERESLERAVDAMPVLLAPGGRVGVISYHSVEDRIVKRGFSKYSGRCVCPPGIPVCNCGRSRVLKVLTRKPLVPRPEEIDRNPSARSAKMRVAEKM